MSHEARSQARINKTPLAQNKNFNPNWITRMGDTKLVMKSGPPTRPACVGSGPSCPVAGSILGKNCVPAFREPLGGAKFGVLNALKNSARNWSFMDSRIGKFLNSEKSRSWNDGPVRGAGLEL